MGLGNESVLEKNYLVYFVKSQYSKADDDTWICAGAIVTPTQILTAAACLVEMDKIYAIAGYKKYVHGKDIEKDECTKTCKNKVVKISVPKEYKITAKQPGWMNVDVGVAIVQKPYNFTDQSYRTHCSYQPQSILINFDKINELEKTRAVAVGWGGKKSAAISGKNQLLQEAATVIIEKRICANLTSNESKELVNKYLLCASGNSLLEHGAETTLDSIIDQCPSGSNDHGGPLISWVGTQQMVLGVALDSISKPNFDCVSPRIYVSTAKTAKIIKCLLESNETKRKSCNDKIDDKRYQVNDIDIKWPDDLKTNLSSSLSEQKSPMYPRIFVRQGNAEQPFYVRPTKELGNMDEQGNPQQIGKSGQQAYKPQMSILRSNFHYQQQGQPAADQDLRSPNGQYRGQLQGPSRDQMRQPEMESQNPSLEDAYNQPHMSPYNQAQMKSYNQPQMESQNQPEMESFNQATVASFNQPPIDSYNQPQMDSYNQPQIESQNKPVIESRNQPQDQLMYIKGQNPAYKPPQEDLYHQPQMESFKSPQVDSYNQPQQGSFKHPPEELLDEPQKLPAQSYNRPKAESYKKPETGPFNQAQDSYKKPQSSYNHPQIESLKPPPAESYDPLEIISENQPDDEEPYKPPVEPYKQPSLDPYMQQSFKPAPVEPYSRQVDQSHQHQQAQPFGQPLQEAVQPYDYSQAPGADPPQTQPDPSRDGPQTFEQMYSQFQAPGAETGMEQTFEELYKSLHDGSLIPHGEDYETQLGQTFEQPQLEQTNDQVPKILNEPPASERSNDEVKVRPQMPLEYPEYKYVL